MPEGFRPKSPETIKQQHSQASEALGASLLPPSELNMALGLDINRLREEFPNRYKLAYEWYLNFLRSRKNIEEAKDDPEFNKIKKILQALNNLDEYIVNHQAASLQERALRPRQFSVFEDLRNFLEQGLLKGYVKLPTGVGKTVIFIELIKALGLKSLIAVPTNILVNQTEERLGQFADNLDVGKINEDVKKVGGDVTITTYSSLINGVKNGTLDATQFDCVILDEAHTALGKKTSKAISSPGFADKIMLGFTATPTYANNKGVEDILPHEIHSLDIQEAVEEGLLAGFRVIIAKTDVSLKGVSISNSGEYNEAAIENAINVKKRNLAAVMLYKRLFMGKRLVLYCNSIKHALNVAELFRNEGIDVEAVWGEQKNTKAGAKAQAQTLQNLKTGQIKGVANDKLLIAGWDEPGVKVCFNLVPTASLVSAEQRGGRVLRLFGEEQATIVDFIDEDDESRFPVTFAEVANASAIPPGAVGQVSDSKAGKADGANINEIKIEGLELIVDADEVLRFVRERLDKKYQLAPPRWIEFSSLAKELGRSPSTIGFWLSTDFLKKAARQIAIEENIENSVSRFRNPQTGELERYVHPKMLEACKAYKEELRNEKRRMVKLPPPGWQELMLFTKTYKPGVVVRALKRVSRALRTSEKKRFYRPGKINKSPILFISPRFGEELLKIISVIETEDNEPAPEGWVKLQAIRESPLLNPEKNRFPGQFGVYRAGGPAPVVFVSPQFAEYLNEVKNGGYDSYEIKRQEDFFVDKKTGARIVPIIQDRRLETAVEDNLDKLKQFIKDNFKINDDELATLVRHPKFLAHIGGRQIVSWEFTLPNKIAIVTRQNLINRTLIIFRTRGRQLDKKAYGEAVKKLQEEGAKPPDAIKFMVEKATFEFKAK